jgi:actin-related protein 9
LTLAQLGLPESFTPASTRLRTRMFPSGDGKTWEPYKIRQVKKSARTHGQDTEMGGTDAPPKEDEEDEAEYEEDVDSDEGAVYPLTGSSINIRGVG